jgi:hypothetical protein
MKNFFDENDYSIIDQKSKEKSGYEDGYWYREPVSFDLYYRKGFEKGRSARSMEDLEFQRKLESKYNNLQDYNSKSNIFDTLDSYNQLKRKKDPFDI